MVETFEYTSFFLHKMYIHVQGQLPCTRCKIFKNPFLCSHNCDDIYVCVEIFTVLQLFHAMSIRLVCLRSYRSYIRPRLKFNAIKPREMSAVRRNFCCSPFQTPKLYSYDVYSAETFTVLQLSPRYDVNVTVFVSGMYMAALKN